MAERVLSVLCTFIYVCLYLEDISLPEQQLKKVINYIKYLIHKHEGKDEESIAKLLEAISTLVKPYVLYGNKVCELPMVEPFCVEHLKVDEEDAIFRASFRDVLLHSPTLTSNLSGI